MMKRSLLKYALAATSLSVAATVHAIDLAGVPYVQYGDGHSYSLPISQYLDGCEGPGCDFHVRSTPGAIKDLVVLGTGSGGTGVTTNFDGMDGAYATPTKKQGDTWFSTPEDPDPDDSNDNSILHDYDYSWDSSLSSMENFLNGEEMIIFFNNNQVNNLGSAGQTLAAWMSLWITDENGDVVDTVFVFTNDGYTNDGPKPYALVSEGGGGAASALGGDAALYDSGITTNTNPIDDSTPPIDPFYGDNAATDWVVSGGQICLTTDTLNPFGQANVPISCDAPFNKTAPFNHNLGADQVAYAIIIPELNDLMADLFGDGGKDMTQYTLHVDFRFGCDPAGGYTGVSGDPTDEEICTGESLGWGKNLTNGYEQLFIGTASSVRTPAPATLALFGLGLLGMGFARRKAAAQM